MKATLFDPDKFIENPSHRQHSCPVSFRGVSSMAQHRSIPDYQNQWRQAETEKERVNVLVKWAKVTGMLNEAPDIFTDFQKILEPPRDAA